VSVKEPQAWNRPSSEQCVWSSAGAYNVCGTRVRKPQDDDTPIYPPATWEGEALVWSAAEVGPSLLQSWVAG
jgi:hypothetical protein